MDCPCFMPSLRDSAIKMGTLRRAYAAGLRFFRPFGPVVRIQKNRLARRRFVEAVPVTKTQIAEDIRA